MAEVDGYEDPYVPPPPAAFAAYDCETLLIAPGNPCPPLVCASTARLGLGDSLLPEYVAELHATPEEALEAVGALLDEPAVMVLANAPFDLLVACVESGDRGLVRRCFEKYTRGEVWDVQVALALDQVANGTLGKDPSGVGPLLDSRGRQTTRYSLDTCVRLVLGRTDAKENARWRLRYGVLRGIPVEHWPEDARQYPVDDVKNPLEIALVQAGHVPGGGQVGKRHRNLGDLARQVRTDFCLKLGGARGLRTDRAAVEALRAEAQGERDAAVERFSKLGWCSAAEGGNVKHHGAAVKKAVALAYGASGTCPLCGGTGKLTSTVTGKPVGCSPRNRDKVAVATEVTGYYCDGTGLDLSTAPALPRSDGGGVSESRDTLMESGDDDLAAYGEGTEDKVLDTYLPFLEQGVDRPITLSPNVVLATGRASYDGPIQLLPRKGRVRECFCARPGCLFCSTDYPSLELCTLAQTCKWLVGYSKILDYINATGNPGVLHLVTAAQILGRSLDEVVAAHKSKDPVVGDTRQACKPINYMIPGGGGAAKLVLINRKPDTGTTRAPDGRTYPGIRFCLLTGGAERCGEVKVTEWKGRACPPLCKACLEEVEYKLKPAFFGAYPEVRDYFAWVSAREQRGLPFPCLDPTAPGSVAVRGGGMVGVSRWRGGCGYSDGANNGFQAPASDISKDALWYVQREAATGVVWEDAACGLEPGSPSPLAGWRVVVFAHDELFSEGPAETAHLAGPRQAELMSESLARHCPDMVRIKVEPAIMTRWYKSAEPVWTDAPGEPDLGGGPGKRLAVWRPKEEARA